MFLSEEETLLFAHPVKGASLEFVEQRRVRRKIRQTSLEATSKLEE